MTIAVIRYKEGDHSLHAVAVSKPYPTEKPKMQAVNSWGCSEPLVEVTAANFHSAFSIDPVIVACKHGKQDLPVSQVSTTSLFQKLPQMIELRRK